MRAQSVTPLDTIELLALAVAIINTQRLPSERAVVVVVVANAAQHHHERQHQTPEQSATLNGKRTVNEMVRQMVSPPVLHSARCAALGPQPARDGDCARARTKLSIDTQSRARRGWAIKMHSIRPVLAYAHFNWILMLTGFARSRAHAHRVGLVI